MRIKSFRLKSANPAEQEFEVRKIQEIKTTITQIFTSDEDGSKISPREKPRLLREMQIREGIEAFSLPSRKRAYVEILETVAIPVTKEILDEGGIEPPPPEGPVFADASSVNEAPQISVPSQPANAVFPDAVITPTEQDSGRDQRRPIPLSNVLGQGREGRPPNINLTALMDSDRINDKPIVLPKNAPILWADSE